MQQSSQSSCLEGLIHLEKCYLVAKQVPANGGHNEGRMEVHQPVTDLGNCHQAQGSERLPNVPTQALNLVKAGSQCLLGLKYTASRASGHESVCGPKLFLSI